MDAATGAGATEAGTAGTATAVVVDAATVAAAATVVAAAAAAATAATIYPKRRARPRSPVKDKPTTRRPSAGLGIYDPFPLGWGVRFGGAQAGAGPK